MILNLNIYQPTASDRLLLDANVLLYLFGPLAGNSQQHQATYSAFLMRARKAGSQLYFSSLVLSEFVNRYLRIDFEGWRQSQSMPVEFKRHYRSSVACQTTLGDIESTIRTYIYNLARPVSDGLDRIAVDDLLSGLATSDFNDNHTRELAHTGSLKVVTEDGDFYLHRHRIDILTANGWMLRQPQ